MSSDIAVLFDLDGVLVDTEELYFRAYSEVLAPYGVAVTADVYSKRWIQAGTGAEWAVREFGLPMTPQELRERKQPIYDDLVARELRAMPGAAQCVRRLAAHFRCVLATNSWARNVDPAMRVLQCRESFHDLVTHERFARPKPAPDAFVEGARAAGLPPERCVVIEDAEKGLIASQGAGTRCIIVPCALTRGGDFAKADRLLKCLDEVTPELIRDVVASARPDAPH